MRALYRSRSLAAGGLLALALAALVPAVASAKPQPGARPRGFRLFARSLGAMTVNRVYLGLNSSLGNIGGDSTGSSTIGGGFWPKGTGNQFVFNTGPQIAGKISNPGGAWDGDQTGAFFFDPKGTTQNGDGVQPIYNIQDPADAAAWPDAARVPAELNEADNFYNPVLRGAKSASQGDVWFMSWDGNPTLISGRQHPLGVAVEFRGLGWNFPTGNEDIVYFTLTFYNVSSATDEAYVNVRPAIRPIVAQLGKDFVAANNRRVPDHAAPGRLHHRQPVLGLRRGHGRVDRRRELLLGEPAVRHGLLLREQLHAVRRRGLLQHHDLRTAVPGGPGLRRREVPPQPDRRRQDSAVLQHDQLGHRLQGPGRSVPALPLPVRQPRSVQGRPGLQRGRWPASWRLLHQPERRRLPLLRVVHRADPGARRLRQHRGGVHLRSAGRDPELRPDGVDRREAGQPGAPDAGGPAAVRRARTRSTR